MSDFLIWDNGDLYDLLLSNQLGTAWFGSNEILPANHPPLELIRDPRKKVVLIEFYGGKYLGTWPFKPDFSWADLVVCFDSEFVFDQEQYFQHACKTVRNNNVLVITGGIGSQHSVNHSFDKFFSPYLGFFPRVLMANQNCDLLYGDQRPFLFDALLGGKKLPRLFVFEKLCQHGFLESSIVSLHSIPFDQYLEEGGNMDTPRHTWQRRPDIDDYFSPILEELDDPDINAQKKNPQGSKMFYSANHLPNRFYHNSKANVQISVIVPEKIYAHSWFSLISETLYGPWLFLTEKTVKPLFAKRIFVSFSFAGHLKYLRQLGFQTFDTIIDESYDNEQCHTKRFTLAWQQVMFLSKQNPQEVYRAAEKILDHNHRVCLEMPRKNHSAVQRWLAEKLYTQLY